MAMADRFQLLPQEIVQHILCLMPIQEAAKTSILSSQWLHHWTKIPVLVFDEETFHVAPDDELTALEETYGNIESDRRLMTHRSRFFNAIYQTLLKHNGMILEFKLRVMEADVTCVEIHHILSYLAKKGTVEKLTLHFTYKLPSSIFLLEKLTHLHLSWCALTRKPQFNGLSSLTNLHLQHVTTTTSSIIHLLSGCPSLKTLYFDVGHIPTDDDSNIQNMFDCLTGIESLSASYISIHSFAVGRAIPQPVSLIGLTYMHLDEMNLEDQLGMPLILFLLRSSPNLEQLLLLMSAYVMNDNEPAHDASVDIHGLQLLHLHYFQMDCVMNIDADLDFVEIVLACSPKLQRVRITVFLEDELHDVEQIVSTFEHVSPDLDLIVRFGD